MSAPKALTEEFILKKTKNSSLEDIHNLSLWGQNLTDVSEVKRIPNLETCAFSVNAIEDLKAFSPCKNLRELFLRKNKISGLEQLFNLVDLKNLRVLWLSDNPIATCDNYRLFTIALLPQLTKLDQIDITEEERKEAKIMFPDPLKALSDVSKPSHSPRSHSPVIERVTPQQEAAYKAIQTLLPFMSKSELQALKASIAAARSSK